MSKTKKKLLITAGLILLLILIIGVKFLMVVQDYNSKMAAINIREIDLTETRDGSYIGAYDVSVIKVEVLVDVKDHKIVNIELLEHRNGQGAPAEAIIPEVIKAQSVQVDAISGATSSSKVILKAIEVAIENTI